MDKKKIKVDESKGLFGVDLKKLANKSKSTTKKTVKKPKRK